MMMWCVGVWKPTFQSAEGLLLLLLLLLIFLFIFFIKFSVSGMVLYVFQVALQRHLQICAVPWIVVFLNQKMENEHFLW